MKIKLYLLSFFLMINTASAKEEQDFAKIFDTIWSKAKENIYPASLVSKFTDEQYFYLHGEVKKTHTIRDLSRIINRFLQSLSVSHTAFYTSDDEAFYFLKSTFKKNMKLSYIGVQLMKDEGCRARVREVLDGFPAFQLGIKRGDCLLSLNGKFVEFDNDFKKFSSEKVPLSWKHQNQVITKFVRPKAWNISNAFHQATKASSKVINISGKKIGHVHLWSGSHPKSASYLDELVKTKFKNVDGLILDLRGGYGGAWLEHLAPFYPDTSSFFKATQLNRDGSHHSMTVDYKKNPHFFKKPMVVIVNEGVRSGKEALAYEFKKSKRAVLVGVKTAGYFVAGRPFFVEDDLPYVLYLSVSGLQLDGENIEGIGVRPDFTVEYPLTGLDKDPQYDFAIKKIQELI